MKASTNSSNSLQALFEEKAKIAVSTQEKNKRKEEKNFPKLDNKQDIKKAAPTTTYLERENSLAIFHYGSDVYKDLIHQEKLTVFPNNVLKKHGLESNYRYITQTNFYRTKLVDWMMEVVHAFCCETEAIFLSVSIMDLYLSICKNKIPQDQLHLISATSIYMASKMEDIMPISVNSVVNKILHNKYNQ